tara:strand:+ start:507 stop:1253 length:747 start_codon:yes stop_codon:yes gene_type:complete
MNIREMRSLNRAVKKYLASHDDLLQLGVQELQMVTWNIRYDTWLISGTDCNWLHEFNEKKLDKIGCQYLQNKVELLDPSKDLVKRYRDQMLQQKQVDTIITKLTPSGYDEMIVSTRKELNCAEIKKLHFCMPVALKLFKEYAKDYCWSPIKKSQFVYDLHKSQSSHLLEENLTGLKFSFGDLELTANELKFVRGVVLGYKKDQYDMASDTVYKIKRRLMQKLGVHNTQQLMVSMCRYGVVDYVVKCLI